MANNVLLTGASGYLGGDFLTQYQSAQLPNLSKLFALVRTDEQAEQVKKYGAIPLKFSLGDEAAVKKALVENGINVVYYLIGAYHFDSQPFFLSALKEVKEKTGNEVHFLYTSGAKMLGDIADAPTYRPLYDNDPNLYELQKGQKPKHKELQIAVNTNCKIIEEGQRLGVKTYIFFPCIVYGESRGFGNKISIQTVDIVLAAKAVGKVYKFREGFNYWPVCHIEDNTSLYLSILRAILGGQNPDYGKNGYYLASPGRVNWNNIYSAMAAALAKHEIVPKDQALELPSDGTLGRIVEALGQPEKTSVEVKISGNCTFTAEHGKALGWKPKYSPEDMLASADREVELILGSLTEKHVGLR